MLYCIMAAVSDVRHPQGYQARGIVTVVALHEITYKSIIVSSGDTVVLKLDVYADTAIENKKKPVILFVHGGGFWEGDKRSTFYQQMATAFAQQGYVAVSANYRLKEENEPYSKAILDTCVADVMDAVRWIQQNGSTYRMDTTKLFICGDSAGGGIVINASYRSENQHYFMGCIDLWGGLPSKRGWLAPIFTGSLSDTTPPTCILHGKRDRIVPVRTSLKLQKKLDTEGIPHEMHLLDKAQHYPVERVQEIIQTIMAFTNKILTQSQ